MNTLLRAGGIAGLFTVLVPAGGCGLFEYQISDEEFSTVTEQIQHDVPEMVAELGNFDFAMGRDFRDEGKDLTERSCAEEAMFGEELAARTYLYAELVAEVDSPEQAEAAVEAAEERFPSYGWEAGKRRDHADNVSTEAVEDVPFTRAWDGDSFEVEIAVAQSFFEDEDQHAVRVTLMSDCVGHSNTARSMGDYSLEPL